ncbi:hypothetical protein SDJN02_14904, partial [Cucurbita argyrosperma subsp. argyrosperma]
MAIAEEEQTLNRERCKRKMEEKRSKEEEGGKGKSNFFGVSRGSSACLKRLKSEARQAEPPAQMLPLTSVDPSSSLSLFSLDLAVVYMAAFYALQWPLFYPRHFPEIPPHLDPIWSFKSLQADRVGKESFPYWGFDAL